MLEVNVIKKRLEAQGICSFELGSVCGAHLPAFSAGAHVDVHIAPGLIRQYSLCNSAQERGRYLIGVLNDPDSRGGSRFMHERVNEGDRLQISEPRNLFELEPDASKYLLFAGGIGITPILAMAYSLSHRGKNFELHYCSRSPDRAAFLNLISESAFADRVVTHFDDGAGDQKLDARSVLGEPREGQHLYVCGPTGFMDFVLATARQCGWPQEQVHREYFSAPDIEHDADQAFEVELARSGQVFVVPAGRSVFEVLDEAGIAIETSCEQGLCGACVTGVLAGVPDHRDQFMSLAEQARNDCFTPCCSRARSPRLVLDL